MRPSYAATPTSPRETTGGTRTIGRVRPSLEGEGGGVGVIDSSETPGGCWAHFSAVLVAGYQSLEPGQDVELAFERPGQEGFSFRAVEVWPVGETPVRSPPEAAGPAYGSILSISVEPTDIP